MSKDILNEMILEQLEPKLRELLGIEEPVEMLQEKGPIPAARAQTQTKAPEGEKIGVFKKGRGREAQAAKAKKGFLDVSAIVSRIVATTEAKEGGKEDPRGQTLAMSVEESFDAIRSKVASEKELGNTASEINDYIVSFFEQSDEADTECTDISTIASRALINSAYFRILEAYNASAAGFVNEAFLANLLGGSTVPTGTRAFEGSGFDNIADIIADSKHFSLKTKKTSSAAQGSITNFLATLGIPFVTLETRGRPSTKKSDSTKDENEKLRFSENIDSIPDLYYIFFGKPSGKGKQKRTSVFSISTLKVSRERVIEYLTKRGVELIQMNDKSYFDLRESSKIKELQGDKEFVLSFKASDLRDEKTILGVQESQKVFKEISFKKNIDFSKQQAEQLGEQLTYSLNRINEFFISIEETIIAYASSPSLTNLDTFQKKAQTISTAGTETIDRAFTCK
jgi:hypothetical protein